MKILNGFTGMLKALLVVVLIGHGAVVAKDKEFVTAFIVVTVPEGTPDVYITGNIKHFGPWWAEKEIMAKKGNQRIYRMEVPKYFKMEYKFTLGNWEHEAIKKNGRKYKNFKMKVTKDNQVFEHTVDDWKGEWRKKFNVEQPAQK